MSILIKDLNKPPTCGDCWFVHCNRWRNRNWGAPPPDDCPIEATSATDKNVVEWIPVAERLPNEYTRVIGYMAWKAMTAIEYQNGKWYSIDHLEPLPDEAVTHWMPLPEPPKEEA